MDHIETPLKVMPFLVASPFYRFHSQTASIHFQPFAGHEINSEFQTSDYDLSEFSSHKYGIGIKYAPLFGFFNKINLDKDPQKIRFKKLELRASKYFRMDKSEIILKAFIITIGATFTIK